MKKEIILFVILITIFLTKGYSQLSEKYYYAFEEKISITELENKLIICFQKGNFEILETIIDASLFEWKNDSICIIKIEDGQKDFYKKILQTIDGIKSIQPIYKTVHGTELGITDEIVIRFYENVSETQKNDLHQQYSVNLVKTTDLYQLISVNKNLDVLEIANQYQTSGLVEFSHPNFLTFIEKHHIPDDPYFINQYYLLNIGQNVNGNSCTAGADIRATNAWDITQGSSDIIIAVVDDGVVSDHPDLPNSRQVRLNGSNFADNPPGNDPSPYDSNNHGTSCSGIIAATHNDEGIAGIAPN